MVDGLWLKGAWPGSRGRRRRPPPATPPLAGLPWAMNHEPLTIDDRLINELFDYIL